MATPEDLVTCLASATNIADIQGTGTTSAVTDNNNGTYTHSDGDNNSETIDTRAASNPYTTAQAASWVEGVPLNVESALETLVQRNSVVEPTVDGCDLQHVNDLGVVTETWPRYKALYTRFGARNTANVDLLVEMPADGDTGFEFTTSITNGHTCDNLTHQYLAYIGAFVFDAPAGATAHFVMERSFSGGAFAPFGAQDIFIRSMGAGRQTVGGPLDIITPPSLAPGATNDVTMRLRRVTVTGTFNVLEVDGGFLTAWGGTF